MADLKEPCYDWVPKAELQIFRQKLPKGTPVHCTIPAEIVSFRQTHQSILTCSTLMSP